MRISNLMTNTFKGIKPKYKTDDGFEVTPIAKDPTKEEILEAQKVAICSCDRRSGRSGSAVFYPNKDLVVKYCFPNRDEYLKHETQALDNLWESGVKDNPCIQEGQFSFVNPAGTRFLITKKLTGKPIAIENGRLTKGALTKENIKSAVDALCAMDYPVQTGKLTPTNLPFDIPMHYDLCFENFLVTPKKAQILDFEHFERVPMKERYFLNEKGDYGETNCNFSDIPGTISNLRGFELRTLLPVLMTQDRKNARNLFDSYLKDKSEYHKKQAEKLKELNKDGINEPLNVLAKKHEIHSRVLAKGDYSVMFSEAMKIQLANYIHIQSPFDNSCVAKFNPNQVIDYVSRMDEYFNRHYDWAINDGDADKKQYFLDCIQLLQRYRGVIDRMYEQEYDELFNKKVVDDELPTLDKLVQN